LYRLRVLQEKQTLSCMKNKPNLQNKYLKEKIPPFLVCNDEHWDRFPFGITALL
jgi:hypothetical protein